MLLARCLHLASHRRARSCGQTVSHRRSEFVGLNQGRFPIATVVRRLSRRNGDRPTAREILFAAEREGRASNARQAWRFKLGPGRGREARPPCVENLLAGARPDTSSAPLFDLFVSKIPAGSGLSRFLRWGRNAARLRDPRSWPSRDAALLAQPVTSDRIGVSLRLCSPVLSLRGRAARAATAVQFVVAAALSLHHHYSRQGCGALERERRQPFSDRGPRRCSQVE